MLEGDGLIAELKAKEERKKERLIATLNLIDANRLPIYNPDDYGQMFYSRSYN